MNRAPSGSECHLLLWGPGFGSSSYGYTRELERLAERAGDTETVRVARVSRTEEEAMAARISENWGALLDLTLRKQGLLPGA